MVPLALRDPNIAPSGTSLPVIICILTRLQDVAHFCITIYNSIFDIYYFELIWRTKRIHAESGSVCMVISREVNAFHKKNFFFFFNSIQWHENFYKANSKCCRRFQILELVEEKAFRLHSRSITCIMSVNKT